MPRTRTRRSPASTCRLALLLLLFAAAVAHAQAGDLDPAFGTDVGYTPIAFDLDSDAFDIGQALLVQPNGKLVAVGTVNRGYDRPIGVAGLRPDGLPDRLFGYRGRQLVTWPGADVEIDIVRAALDRQNRIVLVGSAVSRGVLLSRLLADGRPDLSFGTEGRRILRLPDRRAGFVAYGLAVDDQGRWLVAGGYLSSVPGAPPYRMAALRLLEDGTPDPSFGNGGVVVLPIGDPDGSVHAFAIALAAGGRILLTGYQIAPTSSTSPVLVARLLPDGSADPSFGNGGLAAFPVGGARALPGFGLALAVGPGGSIYVGGFAMAPARRLAFVARLTAAGALDPSFAGDGERTFLFAASSDVGDCSVEALRVQSDGKLIAAGSCRRSGVPNDPLAMATARFRTGGGFDATWATGGRGLLPVGSWAYVASDAAGFLGSQLVLGGSMTQQASGWQDFVVLRLLGDD